jgi:hypothetical protein
MYNKKPEFAIANPSVLEIVTELHNYFRDLQSYYKIAYGEAASQLEASTDSHEHQALLDKIKQIDEKMTLFHVLNNSISTVSTLMHTDTMIEEFKK